MTVQEKKRVQWAAGIVVTALYFGPSLMTHIRGVIFSHAVEGAGPKTIATAPPPPVRKDAPDPGKAQDLSGSWKGQTFVPDRGACSIHVEINPVSGKEGQYSADTSLSCAAPFQALGANAPKTPADAMAQVAERMTPTSAILSGAVSNGSIVFHVDQNIGVNQTPTGCDMTALTVTPFGATRVVITWKETDQGICHGGQLVASH
jgi:hypothetical protein